MQGRHVEVLEERVLLANVKFAVIGDYGMDGTPEADVANLVKSWNPDFIVTTGDNNYDTGSASTIDKNIGKHYHDFIYNYTGSYGAGSATRRFYPVLGNHDWDSGQSPGWKPYGDYFDLPGNERYYDFIAGPVHFFMLDSDPREPDGITRNSIQATWLRNAMAASSSPHKVVIYHHAAYSSSAVHGSNLNLRWPYSQWGATATFAGHDHLYERSSAEGITHIVNGLGGRSLYTFGTPIPESQFRYASNYGAQLVTADDTTMTMQFYARTGTLIDTHTIDLTTMLPIVSVAAGASSIAEAASTNLTFSRTGSTDNPLNIPITLSGTAMSGSDFLAVPTIITIPAGESSVVVPINGVDDTLGESNETLHVSITPTNAQYEIGLDGSASITLNDNDSGPSQLLFAGGSSWKYKDDNVAQASGWKNPGFNDAAWPSGNARFGYGDPGMVTTINGGPTGNRTITHYFRTTWNVSNPEGVTAATLNLLRDDGAVVYINGGEVLRSNMPDGNITHSTLASSAAGGTDETTFFASPLTSLPLAASNTLAVELHQNAITTSDAVFDLYITGVRDIAAPQPRSAAFAFESGQQATFAFSEPVSSLTGGDLVLTDLATNQPIAADFSVTLSGSTATFSAVDLPDGNYRATLPAGSYTDTAGNLSTSPISVEFFILAADANRDRLVDTQDFNLLAANFGGSLKVFSQGNFDYTGTVDSQDFNLLIAQYGKRLPAPAMSLLVGGGVLFADIPEEIDGDSGAAESYA